MKPTAAMARAFEGKTVILTGAASGIGRALAPLLTASGATLHALDVNAAGLADLKTHCEGPGELHTDVVDVADYAAVESAVTRISKISGRIDHLFNNAGVTLLGEAQNIPFERWKWLLDINLMGVVHGTHAVYPIMIAQGFGHIINTSSIAGATGYATAAAYTTSKAAVLEFSRSLMAEARLYGVKITVACPGYVDSGIFAQDRIVGADRAEMIRDLPVKMMSPEEAAGRLLAGVIRGGSTVIFPLSARFLWHLSRWAPSLTTPFQKRFLRVFTKSS